MIGYLGGLGFEHVENLVTVEEDVHFPLPAELLEERSRRGSVALPTI
jgi:hypothetical protein